MERKFGHNKECIQQDEYGPCRDNEKVLILLNLDSLGEFKNVK